MSDFSVVIPTYRRPDQLRSCLEGLSRLDYPRDRFEIVVVDDGSPEAPDGVIAQFRDRLDLTFIVQPNTGPAAARNHGARRARFTHLAFIDDDCVPDSAWLAGFRRAFEAAPANLVGGCTINALPQNAFSSASEQLVSYLKEYFDGRDGRTRLFTSNNMAVRADDFRASGGFDTRFPRAAGEDRELCDRWVSQGRGTTLARRAIVMHAHPLTLKTFWSQHVEYGRGAASFRRARARRRGDKVRVEPLSFYAGLLKSPFNDGEESGATGIAALLLLSQMANAFGFFSSRHHSFEHAESGSGRIDAPPPVRKQDDLEKLAMMRNGGTPGR